MNRALFNLPVLTTAAFSLAATAVIVGIVFFKPTPPPPPTLLLDEPWDAPEFSVTDHLGNTHTRQSMLGTVWVCDFFLTRCNGICPTLGRTMADLASDLPDDPAFQDVTLISFSVDPEHDTLEAMNLYRKINMGVWAQDDPARQNAIDTRWRHTRAEEQEPFWNLVREHFKVYVGPSEGDPTTPVAHSSKLVLIDKQGRIRGYYDGLTDDDIPALMADINRLVDPGSDPGHNPQH